MRGEVGFCIGMSEPGSGSDLFAAKTKATRTGGGWLINGTKIWTSNAHQSDYMIGLFRTSAPTRENRSHGLTSFLVDMKTPGVRCNQIGQMSGQREFNEVVSRTSSSPMITSSAKSTARGNRRQANLPMSGAGLSGSSRPTAR